MTQFTQREYTGIISDIPARDASFEDDGREMTPRLKNLIKHRKLWSYKESFIISGFGSIKDLSYLREDKNEYDDAMEIIGITGHDKLQFKILLRQINDVVPNHANHNKSIIPEIKHYKDEEIIVQSNVNSDGSIDVIDLSSPTPPNNLSSINNMSANGEQDQNDKPESKNDDNGIFTSKNNINNQNDQNEYVTNDTLHFSPNNKNASF